MGGWGGCSSRIRVSSEQQLGVHQSGGHHAEGAKGPLAWCLVAAPADAGAGGCEDLTLGVSCFHLGGPTAAHRLTSGHLREEQETWAHL